jgi:PPOX class probable F420-dependent enzyme
VGVSMGDEEAWKMVMDAATGILTTLRKDGRPVALPVWFVVIEGVVYVRTAERSQKASRIRRDPRVHFLVEDGEAWEELRAVSFGGVAAYVDDESVRRRVLAARAEKYRHRQMSRAELPTATVAHYDAPGAVLAITPTEPFVTWDNRKVRREGR